MQGMLDSTYHACNFPSSQPPTVQHQVPDRQLRSRRRGRPRDRQGLQADLPAEQYELLDPHKISWLQQLTSLATTSYLFNSSWQSYNYVASPLLVPWIQGCYRWGMMTTVTPGGGWYSAVACRLGRKDIQCLVWYIDNIQSLNLISNKCLCFENDTSVIMIMRRVEIISGWAHRVA